MTNFKIYRIKQVGILMIFLFLNSCSQNQTTSDNLGQSEAIQKSPSTECANKPQVSLKEENIENIDFDNSPVTQSGIIRKNEMIGYRFQGESDQRLNYQTNDNICVWIFTPNNQLLQQSQLPITGTYIMQVSTPIGSRTFDITVNLESAKPLASNSKVTEDDETTIERVSPRKAVIQHYQTLNQRNYNETWNKLSPNFKQQKLSNRFSTYKDWWNQVRRIEIGEVEIINQFEETAVVNAQLTYLMRDGEQYKDKKSQIILIWDAQKNAWLIDEKTVPSNSNY
jgi:hypothetical protein